MTLRPGLRGWHDVERIRDESIDRVGDKQSAYNEAHEQAEVFDRLIGELCQGMGSDSDMLT